MLPVGRSSTGVGRLIVSASRHLPAAIPVRSTLATLNYLHMPGGKYDSSRTRVAPVFEQLKANGGDWVRSLLADATDGHPKAEIQSTLDLSFQEGFWGRSEQGLRPASAFLQWLASNPQRLRHRTSDSVKRQRLLGGDSGVIAEALRNLTDRTPDRAWYVFEGRTYPDAVIYTPDAVIVIEGKRTEAGPTVDTTWLTGRHQMWRHIEAAWEVRGTRRVYGLFIVEGDKGAIPKVWRDAAKDTISEGTLASSLPHRNHDERDQLARCFLGVHSWEGVCAAVGLDFESLPHTTDDPSTQK